MSDSDSDADSILDPSKAHRDDDGGDEDSSISPAVRVLCDRLRANDPHVLNCRSGFNPTNYALCSEREIIAVFQALKQNTSVKHFDLMLFKRIYTKRSAEVAAEYVESSQTLQSIDLRVGFCRYSHEMREMSAVLLHALSRNTSATKLVVDTGVFRFDCVAFQELLTSTQTLQKMSMVVRNPPIGDEELHNEVDVAAITSGFASNTTLRDLEFQDWREADLAPVMTALQEHPALQKICFSTTYHEGCLPSLSGLEVLLRSQDSKVKELILKEADTNTAGLHKVMQELGRNTTVTNLVIRYSVLSRENVQQLKSMLRRTTALESLDLTSSALGSAGLAEIIPVLYRNISIKALDLTNNGLDDIESANALRELIRRNKTITSLCIARNAFGRNAAAARSIADGVRSNTTLQQLDLSLCRLDDQGTSFLASALVARNASILALNLNNNEITSAGVRALVEHSIVVMKTLTKLSLWGNTIRSEGATILADALGSNAMPSLKRLDLGFCGIGNDGFVALVSALEQNTSLQTLKLLGNDFDERGYMALAESLPNIKGLQQINFTSCTHILSTILPLLLEGFRKNTSLVEVSIGRDVVPGNFLQEMKFLGQRNRFTPLLKASDSPGASPWHSIWSRALAKVATEPDILFHVLRNKPKLVGSAGGSKKRNRDDE
jgi:Ran GTPase-activating protein (RanGAP) involved in mRNA processing and transport